MIPYAHIIDKYYESGSPLAEILIRHSSQVRDKALAIAESKKLDIGRSAIECAAMLHDIGIVYTNAPGIMCMGTEPYIRHGILGARLLRSEGMPEWVARVAERHTGAGLTASEIISQGLPLPPMDFLPETLLEQLVCYADKFYSKSGDMQEKTLDRVRKSLQKFGGATIERFEALHRKFG